MAQDVDVSELAPISVAMTVHMRFISVLSVVLGSVVVSLPTVPSMTSVVIAIAGLAEICNRSRFGNDEWLVEAVDREVQQYQNREEDWITSPMALNSAALYFNRPRTSILSNSLTLGAQPVAFVGLKR